MKALKIVIEKNVPIPNTKGRKLKYPFDKMKIGDSFKLKNVPKNTILNAAKSWAKRQKNKYEFTIRYINGATRIWRIK